MSENPSDKCPDSPCPVNSNNSEACEEEERLEPQNDRQIWESIEKEFYKHRKKIEDFKKSKDPESNHPLTRENVYLNEHIFPTLNNGLIEMLKLLRREDFFQGEGAEPFNAILYIAEYLWNMNPKHPQRRGAWKSIFDINWKETKSEEVQFGESAFDWMYEIQNSCDC